MDLSVIFLQYPQSNFCINCYNVDNIQFKYNKFPVINMRIVQIVQ